MLRINCFLWLKTDVRVQKQNLRLTLFNIAEVFFAIRITEHTLILRLMHFHLVTATGIVR